MDEFFMSVWKTRPHRSEVSGSRLYEPVSSTYFHHILPSRKYEQAKYDAENIILLTGYEHASVEMNMFKYEEVNNRRKLLKIKYNIL